MINRVHILGASGSGTSTLGKALAAQLGYKHFDADDYFWVPTEDRFTVKREPSERERLLRCDLEGNSSWILSGSLCGWGDVFIPLFELAVFLWIPEDIRIKRLISREYQRYGNEMNPGGKRYEASQEFIKWAYLYENGGLDVRSKALHNWWLSRLPCPVLRIERDISLEESVHLAEEHMESL